MTAHDLDTVVAQEFSESEARDRDGSATRTHETSAASRSKAAAPQVLRSWADNQRDHEQDHTEDRNGDSEGDSNGGTSKGTASGTANVPELRDLGPIEQLGAYTSAVAEADDRLASRIADGGHPGWRFDVANQAAALVSASVGKHLHALVSLDAVSCSVGLPPTGSGPAWDDWTVDLDEHMPPAARPVLHPAERARSMEHLSLRRTWSTFPAWADTLGLGPSELPIAFAAPSAVALRGLWIDVEPRIAVAAPDAGLVDALIGVWREAVA